MERGRKGDGKGRSKWNQPLLCGMMPMTVEQDQAHCYCCSLFKVLGSQRQRTHQVRGPSSLTMPPTAYGSVVQSYTFSSLFYLLTHSSGGVVAFPLLNTHVIWVYCILSFLERRTPDLLSDNEIEGGYVSHLMARNQGPTSETQGSSPTPKLPSREH